MIGLDHEKSRGCPYCPLMREECNEGSTKSMKGKKCAGWRALPMFDRTTNMAKEVHACSVYEWPPALGFEISGFLQATRASIDKTATEVQRHHASFLGVLSHRAQARLIESRNGNEGPRT